MKDVRAYLEKCGLDMSKLNTKKIKNKLADLENTWKEANAFIQQTGDGLEERDAQCNTIKGKST